MTHAFERGFVSELRNCLGKVAASAPGTPPAERPPPTRPASPFTTPRSGEAPTAPPKPPKPPPGIGKAAGVASGLERLYETIGPSAEAARALQYVTPRMDAHRLGHAAAKVLARRKPGFGDLLATGMRSAGKARGAIEKSAGLDTSLGQALRSMVDRFLEEEGRLP